MQAKSASNDILWSPDPERLHQSAQWQLAERAGCRPEAYEDLHRWSISVPDAFRSAVWDFCHVMGHNNSPGFDNAVKGLRDPSLQSMR